MNKQNSKSNGTPLEKLANDMPSDDMDIYKDCYRLEDISMLPTVDFGNNISRKFDPMETTLEKVVSGAGIIAGIGRYPYSAEPLIVVKAETELQYADTVNWLIGKLDKVKDITIHEQVYSKELVKLRLETWLINANKTVAESTDQVYTLAAGFQRLPTLILLLALGIFPDVESLHVPVVVMPNRKIAATINRDENRIARLTTQVGKRNILNIAVENLIKNRLLRESELANIVGIDERGQKQKTFVWAKFCLRTGVKNAHKTADAIIEKGWFGKCTMGEKGTHKAIAECSDLEGVAKVIAGAVRAKGWSDLKGIIETVKHGQYLAMLVKGMETSNNDQITMAVSALAELDKRFGEKIVVNMDNEENAETEKTQNAVLDNALIVEADKAVKAEKKANGAKRKTA